MHLLQVRSKLDAAGLIQRCCGAAVPSRFSFWAMEQIASWRVLFATDPIGDRTGGFYVCHRRTDLSQRSSHHECRVRTIKPRFSTIVQAQSRKVG